MHFTCNEPNHRKATSCQVKQTIRNFAIGKKVKAVEEEDNPYLISVPCQFNCGERK